MLFAAINGTHETTGRSVAVGINRGRKRSTCYTSISTALGPSIERRRDPRPGKASSSGEHDHINGAIGN